MHSVITLGARTFTSLCERVSASHWLPRTWYQCFSPLALMLSLVVMLFGTHICDETREIGYDLRLIITDIPKDAVVLNALMLIVFGLYGIFFYYLYNSGQLHYYMNLGFSCSVTVILVLFVGTLYRWLWLYLDQGDLETLIAYGLEYKLDHYGTTNETISKLDHLQQKLECCGVDNSTDWLNTDWSNLTNLPYPPSCCALNICTYKNHDLNLFNQGCRVPVADGFSEMLYINATIYVALCVIMVLCQLITMVGIRCHQFRLQTLRRCDYAEIA